MQREVAVYRDVLHPSLLAAVVQAVNVYLDSEQPPLLPDSMHTTLCATHWAPLTDEEPAAHPIEQLVAALYRLIRRGASPLHADEAAGLAGGEWWVQEQALDDCPKEFHTDQDLCLLPGRDGVQSSVAHPALSSVFYLDGIGGATAVFAQRRCVVARGVSTLEPPLPPHAALAFPTPNQLLLFRGDLLHGVLQPLGTARGPRPTDEAPRRTVLVNFWNGRPSAAHAPAPPLPPPHAADERRPASPSCADFVQLPASSSFEAERWREQRLPETAVGSLPKGEGPPPPVLLSFSSRPPADCERCGAGVCWYDRHDETRGG